MAATIAVEVLVSARVVEALRRSPYGLADRAVRSLLRAWGPPLRPWFAPAHGVVLPRRRKLTAADLERCPEPAAFARLRGAGLRPVLVEVRRSTAWLLAEACKPEGCDFVLSVAEALEHVCTRVHARPSTRAQMRAADRLWGLPVTDD